MKRKRCAGAGAFVNSIARSIRYSTSAPRSREQSEMLTKGAVAKREDAITPEEEIKDPYVLEFLGLKDEYLSPKLKKRSFCISNGSF